MLSFIISNSHMLLFTFPRFFFKPVMKSLANRDKSGKNVYLLVLSAQEIFLAARPLHVNLTLIAWFNGLTQPGAQTQASVT